MPDPAIARVTALIDAREPACGTTRVVAIDGPSGSGKSTFADRLALATGAEVLRLDDLYPGWHGLAATPRVVADDVLARIAVGESGAAFSWDWTADRPGELLHFPPVPLLVVDGVGSGSSPIRPYLSVLVWIDGPETERRSRALQRDGATYEPWWDVWAAQERELFTTERTAEYADLRLRSAADRA